ncbi:MAG: UDP-N-acetylglucosamine 2-epimerase (non-hydrolyzing) [Pyrinomonadaceae bacterium]|nr:UDP-N-acetylglucosamine 2-epimerase (non-hydrolyzing) [Pyrinomonadaceae bacterium]
MQNQKLAVVIGARPQFIKHAPVEIAFKKFFNLVSIHTGQHYDKNMSDIFFEQLKIDEPNYLLNVGSGSHGVQTGIMMQKLEPIIENENPKGIVLYGDTNSTLAGALVGAKLNIPIIHIEAGLRSYNNMIPEEINRVVTDRVSSILFTPGMNAVENLARENIVNGVHNVGDVMCDMIRIAREMSIIKKLDSYESYYYATIHRPYNTDIKERIFDILRTFDELDLPVIFSLHPRTRAKVGFFEGDLERYSNISFVEPLPYFENLQMISNAKAVVTDSGGIHKEAYLLQKQCVTIRSETEWTETLHNGWNTLVFDDLRLVESSLNELPGDYKNDVYGDGKASEKMLEIVKASFS